MDVAPVRAALLCVGAALSCSTPPAAEVSGAAASARAYTALVADPSPNPEEAFPACRALGDPALEGDCALAVALRVRARSTEPLEMLCPQVPDGAWQDECFFMAAEDAQRADAPARAAAACMESGAFKDDCGQHLWQGDLRKLVRGTRGRSLDDRVAAAERLYARWQPRLPRTDIGWRFWQRFFERLLEADAGVDLRRCEGLDDALALRCRYAAAHLYLRRIWDHLHHAEDRARFCSQDEASVVATERLLPRASARPDPLLEAVVTEQHDSVCRAERPGPVEDGVASKKALLEALEALSQDPPSTP